MSPSTGEVVIAARGVWKKFTKTLRRSMVYGLLDLSRSFLGIKPDTTTLRQNEFWALKDVSFELRRGETLGLIGVNGSGKTTLLRLLAGIFPPDKGEIMIKGRVGALIAVGAGFHPHFTGRENTYLNGTILGLTRQEIDEKFDDIVSLAEIGEFLDMPVNAYSSGMRVRLGFSIATAIKPDVLLIDEVLSVGDRSFRAKSIKRIGEILEHAAVVFVSHNMTDMARVCDRSMLLQKGEMQFLGPTDQTIDQYVQLTDREYEGQLVTGDEVTQLDCQVITKHLSYGENLELELSIETSQPIELGACVISLAESDTLQAQRDVAEYIGPLPAGQSTFKVTLGPTYLKSGTYWINVTLLTPSHKSTYAHHTYCDSFWMDSPRDFGVAYQIPVVYVARQTPSHGR
ncbi:MAG: ABC transporter ATP-binding protein [Chloroflexi bacterium]|nr:ABC transporter ATP-binding protein [Chloroflexota bacterium]